MNRYQLRDYVITFNGRMSQTELAKKLGTHQASITKCCAYFGIVWIDRRKDQRGVTNHNYKDGLGRSTINRATRRAVIESDRSLVTCERCGYTRSQELPRHHIDRDRGNNIASNIEVLCVSCHIKEHMSERERDGYGRFMPKQDSSSRGGLR